MDIETAREVPTTGMEFNRPNCPHCGTVQLVAEQSAFSLTGRIRHTWSCDDCGNAFVTSVDVLPRQS